MIARQFYLYSTSNTESIQGALHKQEKDLKTYNKIKGNKIHYDNENNKKKMANRTRAF